MTDQVFAYNWVSNKYGARLQRKAVLYPLVGPAESPEQIITKTETLVRRWRARLHTLHEAGWQVRAGRNKDMQYMRNCPPTFASVSPNTRQCRARNFCPFCYARWVLEVWKRIDGVFPNPRDVEDVPVLQPNDTEKHSDEMPEGALMHDQQGDGRRLRSIDLGGQSGVEDPSRDFAYHLLTRTVEHQHGFTRGHEGETMEMYASFLLTRLANARGTTIEQLGTLGSVAFSTLLPTEAGFKVLHRELHMVPAAYQVPQGFGGEFKRIERPTRPRIFRTVADTCRYPCELMYGDPATTKVALDARRSTRLSGYFGVFRQARKQVI